MTNGPVYMLSYARDRVLNAPHAAVAEFLKHVDEQLQQRMNVEDPGFVDVVGTETGQAWEPTLGEALRTAKVFVPVFERRYFDRPFCGKEWAAFTARIPPTLPDAAHPGPIQPIHLGPPGDLDPLPEVVAPWQHDHADFPHSYRTRGLGYLHRRDDMGDDYRELIFQFADKIIRAARHNAPPVPARIDGLTTMQSAFHNAATGVALVESQGRPPRRTRAQFVFIAGTAEEMRAVRTELAAYGESASDWQPYAPTCDDEIDRIVSNVAWRESFRYEQLTAIGADLVERIRTATRQERKVVVVVVDPWTVQLPGYHERMAELDKASLPSCVVLAPVNPDDAETVANNQVLRPLLDATFQERVIDENKLYVGWVDGREAFEDTLARTLVLAQARIVRYLAIDRAAGSRGPMPFIDGTGRS